MRICRSTIYRSLRTFSLLHSKTKSLSQTSLRTALRGAEDGDLLILHVALQNSGLVIHKREEGYLVETFVSRFRSLIFLSRTEIVTHFLKDNADSETHSGSVSSSS